LSETQTSLFGEAESLAPKQFLRRITPLWTGYGPPEPVWRLPIPYQDRQFYLIPQSAVEALLRDDSQGFCSVKISAGSDPIRIGASADQVREAIPYARRWPA